MSSTGFSVDIRDIQFVLFEELKVHEALKGIPAFADFDKDLYTSILDEAGKLAKDVLWPINGPGDREGCHFDKDTGNVTTPSGYKAGWDAYAAGGWLGLTAPPDLGGIGVPEPIAMAVGEALTGACPALAAYGGLTRGVANLLRIHGEPWMVEKCVQKLYTGEWGGTMCLTEAGAGSAVGDNRCKAVPTEEAGVYLLEGEKIFITGGDQDLTPGNILHLVLARAPGAPSGTKGLSIFLVPKYDFESGARNGVYVTGIEHKMGLKGSATCVLALGASAPCRGYLLGKEGDGMRIMFHLMNEARIAVGIQGLSSASAAYQNSLYYTNERIQGSSLKNMRDADAPRITIVQHADVRRMLMNQRVVVETLRSMLYTTALRLTLAETSEDAAEKERMHQLVELLTPICKAWSTDLGFQVTVTAVQCFGGYGYIGEYPVEQHVRDNKIASIYEGTNGIQAMDLLGRKMRQGGGALFMHWLQEANREIEEAKATGHFAAEIADLEKARDTLGAAAMHLGGLGATGNMEGAMMHSVTFLELFGTVLLGIHALSQATVAQAALDAGASGSEETFYKGKLLNLKWYVAHFLPKAFALSKSIRSGDQSALDEILFRV